MWARGSSLPSVPGTAGSYHARPGASIDVSALRAPRGPQLERRRLLGACLDASASSTGRPTASTSWSSTTPRPTAATGSSPSGPRGPAGPQRRQRRVRGQQPGPARPRRGRLRGPGQRRLVRRARAGCGRWWTALEADDGLGAASARMVFADRFVELTVDSPTFLPGGGDVRELGVMVSGARVDGKDRWRDTQFGRGRLGDRAPGRRQPVPVDRRPRPWCGCPWPTATALPDARPQIELAAEAPKGVTVGSAAARRPRRRGCARAGTACRSAGQPVDVVNNVGSVVFDDGYGADRGFLEADTGQYDEPGRRVRLVRRQRAAAARPTWPTWACSTRGSSSTTRTPTCRGGAAAGAGATATCPAPWSATCTRRRPARARPPSSTTSSATGWLMLAKNAPAPMAVRAVVALRCWSRRRYARRDVVRAAAAGHAGPSRPGVRRAVSFVGFLRLLPGHAGATGGASGGPRDRARRRDLLGVGGARDEGRRLRPLLVDRRRRREVRRWHRRGPGRRDHEVELLAHEPVDLGVAGRAAAASTSAGVGVESCPRPPAPSPRRRRPTTCSSTPGT